MDPTGGGQVARLERRLRLLAEHVPDMIFRYEYVPEARFDYVSPASTAISGYTPEDHYAEPGLILRIVHPDDLRLLTEGLDDPQDDEGAPIVLRWFHRDGHLVTTEQRYRLERDPAGRVVAIEGVVRDVGNRLRRQAELAHDATHDPVTGLANTRLLEEELGRHLARDHGEAVVVVCQLDRFPMVQDLVGRVGSDAVLRQAATRVRDAAPAGAVVARGAGEMFWVVHVDVGREEGERLLRDLNAGFQEPMSVDGRELHLSLVSGARYVDAGAAVAVEEVLDDADAALRAVRSAGVGGMWRWSDPVLRQQATDRLELEQDLREAIGAGDVVVAFQPQVDLADGSILGFEALARWDRPGHSAVPPSVFVDVAEQAGLVADLGDHVLFAASRQLARWRAAGLVGSQRVSVNVSRRQLALPDLADSVLEIVAAAGLAPSGLTIEVTETAVMEAGHDASAHLSRLADHGVRISLDDFGTGWSSLDAIRQLPVDELKVDRSFVREVASAGSSDRAICAAVVALAEGLSLDLVAEGVEEQAQADALRALGCRVGQGFHFGRPLRAADTARLLERSGLPAAARRAGRVRQVTARTGGSPAP